MKYNRQILRHILGSLVATVMLPGLVSARATDDSGRYAYGVAQTKWDETFGAHRAVVEVAKPAEVVELDFAWRRNDRNVADHRFLIVSAATGDTIRNISRVEVDNHRCRLLFGPVKSAGEYYFYYLPHRVNKNHGWNGGEYLKPEAAPSAKWMSVAEHARKPEKAVIKRVESRSVFDSFYPMEVAASEQEARRYAESMKSGIYLFPEDRMSPVRMKKRLPLKWLDYRQGSTFLSEAAPNEYFTFQIAAWHPDSSLKELSYKVTPFVSGRDTIQPSTVTCFNLEGVDVTGRRFTKSVDLAAGAVQPLWFGVDLAADQKPGVYRGAVTVSALGGESATVPVEISIAGEPVADRGDSRPETHSRLRWLNSTKGIADTPVHGYEPVQYDDGTIVVTGRRLTPGAVGVMPVSVKVADNEMLSGPMRFVVVKDGRELKFPMADPVVTELTDGHVTLSYKGDSDGLTLDVTAEMDFDGRITYRCRLSGSRETEVDDVRLEIPVAAEAAPYFLGLGLPGQDTPQSYSGKWDTPEMINNNNGLSIASSRKISWLWPFDSFWTGSTKAGIHCEFLGEGYSGPLLNLYHPPYPDAWHNGGKGGFTLKRDGATTLVSAYSGNRVIPADSVLNFDFAMLVTPVKPLDFRTQFTDRYYHNGQKPTPSEDDVAAGVRVINVHHANELNPFINYPFLSVDEMKEFVRKWHERGCKVKIYYTLRELTTAFPELWAMRSLGYEIFAPGKGGGYSWLQEHMVEDYEPAWYSYINGENDKGVVADAAVVTAENDGRWYNYYVEGLAWLVRELDIDGLYLDDVSFGRDMLQRMRRAMDEVKPGTVIDLHSNTGFSRGPANQYAEFFPYIDKLWFGESFIYDEMDPVNWLVESSGIPFGHTGDMLHAGGNPWLGMQYGMTVRYPWYTEGVSCDPRSVWRIWDEFNIADSEVIGFWEDNVPVRTDNDDVKVTVYRRPDRSLLSIGNYTDSTVTVTLDFDWDALGINPENARLTAPAIEHFQEARSWRPSDDITIEPRRGYLIYVE